MCTASPPSDPPLQRSAPLILVTDDDDISRAMAYEVLRQFGYGVIEASSGQDCLNAYLRYAPDLVLLDLDMPGMDGFQCCEQLRSLAGNKLVPVLILSASTDLQSMEQAFAAGAIDYLTKPVCWPILKQRVWQALRSQQTIADLERQLQQERATAIALEAQLQEQTEQQIQFYQTLQAQVSHLERLNQLKDEALNTVSHELRSPLSNMSLAIQMLEQQLQFIINQTEAVLSSQIDLQKVLSYLKILRDQCQREIYLVNNILDLQHLETGKQPVSPELLHLSSWLTPIIDPFLERSRTRQQLLQLQVTPDLPAISTDPLLLERILTELLTNACKYAPPNATITVAVQAIALPDSPEATVSSYPRMQICVSNTGVEIPAEVLPRLFEPFYRIPQSDRWKQGGSGLGLALVQKMTQRLQGTVQVSSTNKLTRFIVELPLTLNED